MCVQLLQSLTRLTFFIECLIKKKFGVNFFRHKQSGGFILLRTFLSFHSKMRRDTNTKSSLQMFFFGKCTQLPSCVRYPKETWAKIGVQTFSDQIINKSMPFLCNSCEPKKSWNCLMARVTMWYIAVGNLYKKYLKNRSKFTFENSVFSQYKYLYLYLFSN